MFKSFPIGSAYSGDKSQSQVSTTVANVATPEIVIAIYSFIKRKCPIYAGRYYAAKALRDENELHSFLFKLPQEILLHIITFIPRQKNRCNLALSSALIGNSLWFKEYNNSKKMLSFIDLGQEEELLAMLKNINNSKLLFKCSEFTDNNGREFKGVSPLQLMLWSMDFQMISKVINELSDEDKDRAHNQYKELKTSGLTYKFNGGSITESHFNFEPLTTAYTSYIDCMRQQDWNRASILWCENIGMEQRMLPAWLKQAYHDSRLWNNPNLLLKLNYAAPRINIRYVHCKSGEYLGVNFALILGLMWTACWPAALRGSGLASLARPLITHSLIVSVSKIRITQFNNWRLPRPKAKKSDPTFLHMISKWL